MKLHDASAHAVVFLCLILPSAVNAQKLESFTAGATTTPQYAKAVARVYCDFVTAGIAPDRALGQAEEEVNSSSTKPVPFNVGIYTATLETAIREKGFCPAMPKLKEQPLTLPEVCELSHAEINSFVTYRHVSKRVGNCVISITAH